MSQTVSYSSTDFGNTTMFGSLVSFYRRWFAIETVANPNALSEIGLDHLVH